MKKQTISIVGEKGDIIRQISIGKEEGKASQTKLKNKNEDYQVMGIEDEGNKQFGSTHLKGIHGVH